MDNCIFCEQNLRDSGRIVLENESWLAIFDNFPVTLGHSLIISKRHQLDWWKLTKKEQDDFWDIRDSLKDMLDKKYRPAAYNVGINMGGIKAGQTVMHLHVHVFPEYNDNPAPRGGIRNFRKPLVEYP